MTIPSTQTTVTRLDPPPAGPGPARVIEVGEITAGIAVPEHRGVRFYSSLRLFDTLDGRLFRTFEQANRAARDRIPAPAARRRAG